jgi:hypothetical protein
MELLLIDDNLYAADQSEIIDLKVIQNRMIQIQYWMLIIYYGSSFWTKNHKNRDV